MKVNKYTKVYFHIPPSQPALTPKNKGKHRIFLKIKKIHYIVKKYIFFYFTRMLTFAYNKFFV